MREFDSLIRLALKPKIPSSDGRSLQNQEVETTPNCFRLSACEEDLERLLGSLYELEQLPAEETPRTSEEQQAVVHFQDTLRRDGNGRYRVSLPRKLPTPVLGQSRDIALRRYLSNERSLKRQDAWTIFCDAVTEYGKLGHAELVPSEDLAKASKLTYYLPMHGIVNLSSTTTKLRAVCDASSKTSTGVSLNDTLLPGPSLYPLLTTVINRFRTHSIGMTADVSKMFREVGLNDEELDYHRFLHRNDSGTIEDWRMTCLTFGVTTSPYLATQVL